jgi:hypothetical protein
VGRVGALLKGLFERTGGEKSGGEVVEGWKEGRRSTGTASPSSTHSTEQDSLPKHSEPLISHPRPPPALPPLLPVEAVFFPLRLRLSLPSPSSVPLPPLYAAHALLTHLFNPAALAPLQLHLLSPPNAPQRIHHPRLLPCRPPPVPKMARAAVLGVVGQ